MPPWGIMLVVAEIKVRKLPDWVMDTYRTLAEAAGRSLEAELREQLTQAALLKQHQFAAEAARFRRQLQQRYGVLSDSTPGIVEDREQRG
jgi:plasmid stability protein